MIPIYSFAWLSIVVNKMAKVFAEMDVFGFGMKNLFTYSYSITTCTDHTHIVIEQDLEE